MSLDAIVRKGVATAKKITDSLQPYVQVRAWTGQNMFGAATYASAVSIKAIVNQESHLHKTRGGQLVDTQAYVAFLEPLKPNGTAGRLEPIDPRDIIILPDGTSGPIVEISGFFDAGTGRPFFSEVWIGAGGGGRSDV